MARQNEYANATGHPIDLADGRVIGPDETVRLNAEQLKEYHNKQLIDDGLLLKAAEIEEGQE